MAEGGLVGLVALVLVRGVGVRITDIWIRTTLEGGGDRTRAAGGGHQVQLER